MGFQSATNNALTGLAALTRFSAIGDVAANKERVYRDTQEKVNNLEKARNYYDTYRDYAQEQLKNAPLSESETAQEVFKNAIKESDIAGKNALDELAITTGKQSDVNKAVEHSYRKAGREATDYKNLEVIKEKRLDDISEKAREILAKETPEQRAKWEKLSPEEEEKFNKIDEKNFKEQYLGVPSDTSIAESMAEEAEEADSDLVNEVPESENAMDMRERMALDSFQPKARNITAQREQGQYQPITRGQLTGDYNQLREQTAFENFQPKARQTFSARQRAIEELQRATNEKQASEKNKRWLVDSLRDRMGGNK